MEGRRKEFRYQKYDLLWKMVHNNLRYVIYVNCTEYVEKRNPLWYFKENWV